MFFTIIYIYLWECCVVIVAGCSFLRHSAVGREPR